ncbi:glycoside hydrolase family 5 protein [Mangrovibacterium diazotrophicum]|uniref:Endoglucanase n=1 Tax=Mangrovibacterium diazotrophicum TaxID=1261403 RepID=A0A419W2W7_9BACT|nr:glycoside hydrolase family 5 protein [Mangrovibacterium diazotrophicum]RKD89764.1 endoglucanase [Mangrovibacterium diazotrophicum]
MKTFHLVLLMILLCGIQAANAQTPIEKHGALTIADGQIVDAHGQAPQLRGLSFSWSIWNGQKYYNTNVVDWICSDFKVSLIRVSMGIEPEGGFLDNPDFQKELVTTVFDRALENGVYVLIDWHDHHAEKHVEASKAFFAEMAQKYAGNPQVIYEIFNEPDYQSWEVVKDYALQVISVIREYDAENLIVVGSPRWDQNVDEAADDPITGYQNICYSFHFYASDNNHQEQLRQKADYALSKGLPLFVTEWGVGEANGDGKFDMERNRIWLKWMEDHQLSWACWNITDKEETTAFLKPGANINGNWTEDELTPNGLYLRKILNDLNE